MKAIVYTEYGAPDVLHVEEVEKPAPKDNEVLVRVRATPVNFGDLMARNFNAVTMDKFNMPAPLWFASRLMMGLRKPRKTILGNEFAGEIEAIGKNVKRFKKGDVVFGYPGMNFGAYAEYLCMPENGLLAIKPVNMSDAEAAATPYGAITALNLLKKVSIRQGQRVLINGASGGIGSFALQFAKFFGAEVSGVCATPRMELVKSLGADEVIDYTREDFTRNGKTYDLIVDVLGKRSFEECKDSLNPNGTMLYASFKMKPLLQSLRGKTPDGKKVICALSSEKVEDLEYTRELVEAGKIKVIVDRCFPLEQAAQAHRYVEEGNKTGSVILTL